HVTGVQTCALPISGPDADGARNLVALHDLLERERRRDVHGLPRIVPLAMPGSAFDDRVAVGDAGLLRRLRNAVDIRAERDNGFARAPARHEGPRNTGDALFHLEAVLAEQVHEVPVGLDLLKAQFTEAEDLVDHLLCEVAHAFDFGDDPGLQTGDTLAVGDDTRVRRGLRLG